MYTRRPRKIVIIGAGFVGATTAYALMISGLASELILIDVDREKAEGEVMDLNHAVLFAKPAKIYAGDYSDCTNADIIIITAGANQKPGETRLDLVKRNTAIFQDIIPNIAKYTRDSILLVVTNPVDILTYVTLQISGLPKNKVMGSGTVLDSSRFRHVLSRHLEVDPRNIHAYIIGEHGDSEVAVWSLADVAGTTIDKFCHACGIQLPHDFRQKVFDEVRYAGYEIIERKGATYYAIGMALKKIVESIIRSENSVLTVSGLIDGIHGVSDVCLSLPAIVNKNGIERFLPLPLSEDEKQRFQQSANTLNNVLKEIGF